MLTFVFTGILSGPTVESRSHKEMKDVVGRSPGSCSLVCCLSDPGQDSDFRLGFCLFCELRFRFVQLISG